MNFQYLCFCQSLASLTFLAPVLGADLLPLPVTVGADGLCLLDESHPELLYFDFRSGPSAGVALLDIFASLTCKNFFYFFFL